jgi:hypothetical protein
MAAQPWKVFNQAKKNLGAGALSLSNASTEFRCTLFRSSASTTITTNVSTRASLGSFTCSRTADAIRTLQAVTWTGQNSANDPVRVFDCSHLTFTASGGTLLSVRYAVIWQSQDANGTLLAYASLSSSDFAIDTSNTLTIQIAAGGIFTLT